MLGRVPSSVTPPAHDDPTAPDLGREEAWVAHVALLAATEEAVEAGAESPPELDALATLEGDGLFDGDELRLLRDALVTYLGDAPLRDRAPGRAALRSVNAAIRGRPPSA
ncbi:hypothetical protein GCM10027435_11440 [Haloparvum alkalitolerans]